jgi:hypothetical protein
VDLVGLGVREPSWVGVSWIRVAPVWLDLGFGRMLQDGDKSGGKVRLVAG